MQGENNLKRVFFGAEIMAPWPKEFPAGRILNEHARHLTLAFLGSVAFKKLHAHLPSLPAPSFRIGPTGIADKLLFLPKKTPRVAAAHVIWCTEEEKLRSFQQELVHWLTLNNYALSKSEFLPHITLARAPFDREKWKKTFHPLPVVIKAIHLYESMGNLTYSSLWTLPLITPFEEYEHTADIAFHIFGENYQQLFFHAELALAFKFPSLVNFYIKEVQLHSLDEVIIALNEMIAHADAEIGVPFKAVSFHGAIEKREDNLMHWEMIVDV